MEREGVGVEEGWDGFREDLGKNRVRGVYRRSLILFGRVGSHPDHKWKPQFNFQERTVVSVSRP